VIGLGRREIAVTSTEIRDGEYKNARDKFFSGKNFPKEVLCKAQKAIPQGM